MPQDFEPQVVLLTMDLEASEILLSRSDGKEARVPLAHRPGPARSALSKIHITPDHRGLLAVTTTGAEILFEGPRFDGSDQLAGRLVVYLDQNHWSAVANALHYPEKVTSTELAAAHRLTELVHDRQVVMPMSSAHHHETATRFDFDKRYRLGLTMLQLSRGWQVRDPLQVRRNELRSAFIDRYGLPNDRADDAVFSLAPNVLYSPYRGWSPPRPPSDVPSENAFQWEALTEACGHINAVLDADRSEDGPDTGWVAKSQHFSDWLDGEPKTREQKRKAIDAWLFADLSDEIAYESAACGATVHQLRGWCLRHFAADLRHAPATGLFREVLQDRHLNKGTRWRRNDLTDMIYLSCAAGYADIVVGERHLRSVLNQGLHRLGRPLRVHRHLADAVTDIEERLSNGRRGAPVVRQGGP
ncbi:hypothetical protein [Micromonospora sp. NPDC049171]|uniref:hypothetical protein n=1 Tax=Micromonospora sp. NPDC049171 TaxID=3155770 RepID=UPI003409F16D